jgi:hypothetical protein
VTFSMGVAGSVVDKAIATRLLNQMQGELDQLC